MQGRVFFKTAVSSALGRRNRPIYQAFTKPDDNRDMFCGALRRAGDSMAGTYRPIRIQAFSAALLCAAVVQASAASDPAAEKCAGMLANGAGKNQCATGMLQSPIDIEDTDAARIRELGFNYKLSLLTLSNAGRSLSGSYGDGSNLYVGKYKFDLRNIAFRTPSEHRVVCRRFRAEMQFL